MEYFRGKWSLEKCDPSRNRVWRPSPLRIEPKSNTKRSQIGFNSWIRKEHRLVNLQIGFITSKRASSHQLQMDPILWIYKWTVTHWRVMWTLFCFDVRRNCHQVVRILIEKSYVDFPFCKRIRKGSRGGDMRWPELPIKIFFWSLTEQDLHYMPEARMEAVIFILQLANSWGRHSFAELLTNFQGSLIIPGKAIRSPNISAD